MVIDPDVFAVGDVWELLQRDMQGKALMCRPRTGTKGLSGCLASSVMLLDCAKLTHWRCEENFGELFDFERDYADWICLKTEPRESIGFFEDEWNDFDTLTPETRLIHNTKRQTQPGKTGLPVDYTPAPKHAQLWSPHLAQAPRAPASGQGRLPRAPGPEAGGLLLRAAARVPGERRGERGDAARGDAPEPRAPRRPRGAGADAALAA